MGRTVCLGEVFIKTHTKADGSFVDWKAERIAKNYEKNVAERFSELELETSAISDSTSRSRELTADEYTAIFLQVKYNLSQSTFIDTFRVF